MTGGIVRKKIALIGFCIFSWCLPATAQQGGSNSSPPSINGGRTFLSIAPVFAQLVMFPYPEGFAVVFENTNAGSYIREAVLKGETVDRWSQMITVTGAKGRAAVPNITPQSYLEGRASNFKRACPDTFSARALGALKISGRDAFVGLAGCGSVQSAGNKHSENALIISVKGSDDYYTIQWAERGPALEQPADLNGAKWQDRLRKLSPIKLCPRIPGEAPPYPSCINQK